MNGGRFAAVVAVAALAVLSGCAGLSVDVGEHTSGGPTASAPDVANGTTATVVEVVDGDTVDVRYRNGSTDTVRLLGVDTPEVHADNDPAEYEGVPDSDAGAACLESAGENASAFAREWLAGARVTLVVDSTADRRDRYDRLLAYVHVAPADDGTPANETATGGGIDFNERLVTTGHARVYDSTFARSDSYYAAESEAQAVGRGLWRCRTPGADDVDGTGGSGLGGTDGALSTSDAPLARSDSGLTVERIEADVAGNDHENPNSEYVVFGNDGDAPLPLGDWVVRDEGGHSYVFPGGFALGSDETVTLRTGTGTDTDDTLYWGSDSAVWNNDGDAVVVERDGETVLRYAYG